MMFDAVCSPFPPPGAAFVVKDSGGQKPVRSIMRFFPATG